MRIYCRSRLIERAKIDKADADDIGFGMFPALKCAMRTAQNGSNQVCVRLTVFVIKTEAKSPTLPLLECVAPLA